MIRDKRTNKPKGYGFISFGEPWDMTKAMREMDNKYVGSRPVKLKKSTWAVRAQSACAPSGPGWAHAWTCPPRRCVPSVRPPWTHRPAPGAPPATSCRPQDRNVNSAKQTKWEYHKLKYVKPAASSYDSTAKRYKPSTERPTLR